MPTTRFLFARTVRDAISLPCNQVMKTPSSSHLALDLPSKSGAAFLSMTKMSFELIKSGSPHSHFGRRCFERPRRYGGLFR